MNTPAGKKRINTIGQYDALRAFCITLVLALLGIVLLRPSAVPDAPRVAGELSLAILAFWGASRVSVLLSVPAVRNYLRLLSVLMLFDFLFSEMRYFQHTIISGWQDDQLLFLEIAISGTPWGVLLQRVVNPVVTEGMMFAYTVYALLLPAAGIVCYRAGGEWGLEDYLFSLALAFSICFLGFVVYPLNGPLFHMPDAYTVPLGGGFFAKWGEWIRANKQYPGGNLPSPHCAGATVILAMLYRYKKTVAAVSLPTILLLYVSTVYGRYHYAWDGFAGIATGLISVAAVPRAVFGFNFVQRVSAQAVASLRLDAGQTSANSGSLSAHQPFTKGTQS